MSEDQPAPKRRRSATKPTGTLEPKKPRPCPECVQLREELAACKERLALLDADFKRRHRG